MQKILILMWLHPPMAMTHGNKIWVKMKDKYYSTNMKPNKYIRKTFFKPHNKKYGKVLNFGGFWATHPWGFANDPTMTNFDGWLDLNPQKVYKVKKSY
jgi:hypothetical protein